MDKNKYISSIPRNTRYHTKSRRADSTHFINHAFGMRKNKPVVVPKHQLVKCLSQISAESS